MSDFVLCQESLPVYNTLHVHPHRHRTACGRVCVCVHHVCKSTIKNISTCTKDPYSCKHRMKIVFMIRGMPKFGLEYSETLPDNETAFPLKECLVISIKHL